MSFPSSSGPKIHKEDACKLLQEGSRFSLLLKGFEPREQQQQMMGNIIESFNENLIALIEAGTGTGKSLAYLIPAILWAVQKNERTVISTNTITLQEQLIEKDIPLILKALNLNVKAVLLKGMGNYLCLRKLEEALAELLLLSPHEAEELQKVEAWGRTSQDGSRSTLPFIPSHATWDKVCAESDTCTSVRCPYYQDCHFFKARRHASDAHLLISNHNLLFADLVRRAEQDNYKDAAILPAYTKMILDEAHHIEDIATEYFASNISRLDLLKIIGRIAAEKGTNSQGKLPLLREKVVQAFDPSNIPREASSVLSRLNMDLPGMRRDALQHIVETFDTFENFVDSLQTGGREDSEMGERKVRLQAAHQTHPIWIGEIIPRCQKMIESLQRYIQGINAIDKDIKSLDNEKLTESTKGIRYEILALCARLTNACLLMQNFLNPIPTSSVRWIEVQRFRASTNVLLVDAALDITKPLVDNLFSKFPTIVMCSATLTANQHFEFVKKRLGLFSEDLKSRSVIEHQYDSPFNYHEQAMLAVPVDIPSPTDPRFIPFAARQIFQAIQASHGNAFVLFTSYSMLKACAEMIAKELEEHRFTLLKQGDDHRQVLLNKFKQKNRSVLFATDSFWEGVDVAGEALRCVIIVKLPFKVPTEPITQARTEAITADGGNAFMDYSVPHAIVKFKQGFGRLIRHKRDRGCIICLDNRLVSKNYGKQFLNSLPNCKKTFVQSSALHHELSEFYRKTYYLTKS